MSNRNVAFAFLVFIVAAFLLLFFVLRKSTVLDDPLVSVVAIVVAGQVFAAALYCAVAIANR